MWVKQLLPLQSNATISIYWPLIKGFVHLCGITISVITSLHSECLKIQSKHSINVCHRMEWTVISSAKIFNWKTITSAKIQSKQIYQNHQRNWISILIAHIHRSNSPLIYVIAWSDPHLHLINDYVLYNKSINGFYLECKINVKINFKTIDCRLNC